MIKLRFETIDRVRKTKRFKTLKGAIKAAHDWVGENAEIGSYYAVSGDGVVKVTVEGCKLSDIWPNAYGDSDCDDGQGPRESYETGGGEFDPGADYEPVDELAWAHAKAKAEVAEAAAKAADAVGHADAEAATNEYLRIKAAYDFFWKKPARAADDDIPF